MSQSYHEASRWPEPAFLEWATQKAESRAKKPKKKNFFVAMYLNWKYAPELDSTGAWNKVHGHWVLNGGKPEWADQDEFESAYERIKSKPPSRLLERARHHAMRKPLDLGTEKHSKRWRQFVCAVLWQAKLDEGMAEVTLAQIALAKVHKTNQPRISKWLKWAQDEGFLKEIGGYSFGAKRPSQPKRYAILRPERWSELCLKPGQQSTNEEQPLTELQSQWAQSERARIEMLHPKVKDPWEQAKREAQGMSDEECRTRLQASGYILYDGPEEEDELEAMFDKAADEFEDEPVERRRVIAGHVYVEGD